MSTKITAAYEAPDEVDLESAFKFQGDYLPHIKINGISGSGKSTLLVWLALRYIEEGYTVLWREVGKYDLLTRFRTSQDVINWLLSEDCYYKPKRLAKTLAFWEKYLKKEKAGKRKLIKICSDTESLATQGINLFVFDIMKQCSSTDVLIQQYHELFRRLRDSREQAWYKQPDLVVILDEANDLIPTPSKSSAKLSYQRIVAQTWWLRQWRGYHVRFVLSTHSSRQLHIDARMHCAINFWKRSDRKDVKGILDHELIHVDGVEFETIYKRLLSLESSSTLYIDHRGNHSFFDVPWIPQRYRDLEEIREFIGSFKPKMIVAPLDYSWESCGKIAESLYPDIKDKKLYWLVEDKEHGWVITANQKHILNAIMRKREISHLFGHWNVINGVIRHLERLKELEYNLENDPPKSSEIKDSEEFNKFQHVAIILEKDVSDADKVSDMLKFDSKMSAVDIASALDISEYAARKMIYQSKLKKVTCVDVSSTNIEIASSKT